MKLKNTIFATLLAGAVLLPAGMSKGADRNYGSVEVGQFLKTPKIEGSKTDLTINTKSTTSFKIANTTEADIAADGMNIIAGDSYQIADTSVLNATTLGSGVTASSLTSHGNQTRKENIRPFDVGLNPTGPQPVQTTTEGGTANVWQVLRFDGDGGSTGDNHVYIPWHVPDGYVTDSGRLNFMWSCESAETAGDAAVFNLNVLAVASSESVDAAVTAATTNTDVQWSGTADLRFTTQINFEVVDIAVDDVVYLDFSVDESASAFSDTIDIHNFEIEHESTE